MTHKKPEPIFPNREPKLCPICGKASYSVAGIHPQCAVRQADEKRKAILKRDLVDEKKPKPEKASTSASRWQKTCPKCNLSLHVRKKVCSCGYEFAV